MALNYSQYQGVNPLEMAMKGFADAGAIQQAQQQRAVGQQNLELNQMKIAEYQKAQQQKAAFQEALGKLGQKPSAKDYERLIVQFPSMAEALKAPYEMLNEQQKMVKLGQSSQVLAALNSNSPDVAKSLLEKQALAAEGAGDQAGADGARTLIQQIDINPLAARDAAALSVAAAAGPEKFASIYEKISTVGREAALHKPALEKAQSEAQKAAIDAKFAESVVAADAATKGFDISGLIVDPDVAKENKRIANMMAMREKAKSDLQIEELTGKIADAETKRNDLVLAKASEVETAQLNVDTMMGTLAELKTLGDARANSFQTVREAATGPLESALPTASQEVADYEEMINTLKSQVFLTQIGKMKGMGALSGPEGSRLETALRSLSLRQSSERLQTNLDTIETLTNKAQEAMRAKYGNVNVASEQAAGGQPPMVTTQQAFDALAPGALYREADGKTYRKPQ